MGCWSNDRIRCEADIMSVWKFLKNSKKNVERYVQKQHNKQQQRIKDDIKRIDLETKREKKLAELRMYQNKHRPKKKSNDLFGDIKF